MKWYGSLQNRLEEGHQFCDEIAVGTGVTEYSYSDRHPWEVVRVRDQKHVRVRAMKHRHVGDGVMDNNWEVYSDPDEVERDLEKRGDVWYWTTTITREDIESFEASHEELDVNDFHINLCIGGWDADRIREKGKQTKRWKASVSFGTAQYYHDYEF